jgi:hypothetical protein
LRKGWLGPPLLAVERWPIARQDEAVVGLGAGNHPVAAPIFPPRAVEGGDVDDGWIWPRLEVVGTNVVPSLPGLDQHEEVAEERSAGATPTNISQRWTKMATWRTEWGVR